MTTPGIPIIPGSPSSTVIPGESVRPVHTGQKAQLEKADQCLAQSELPVLNSPDRSVQLEHNVHRQPGNMPNLQAEHLSEHSEAFLDFTNSDSPNVKAYESPERTQLRHSGHRSSGIGHTGNPLGIGHTGNRSDQEHGSVRTRHHSDVFRSSRRDSNTHSNTIPLRHANPGEHSPASMIRHLPARSLLALTTLSLRDVSHTGTCSDHEHGSNRTRHHSDVSRSLWRDRNTHRNTILLRHAGPGELSPASMIRYRHARSRSRSYDSVSPRRHSRSPSLLRGKKKKSHKKRKHSSTSSSSFTA